MIYKCPFFYLPSLPRACLSLQTAQALMSRHVNGPLIWAFVQALGSFAFNPLTQFLKGRTLHFRLATPLTSAKAKWAKTIFRSTPSTEMV